jgi:hypothetical protein
MKKILFTISFLLFAIVIFAQPIIDVGVKAGVNNSKITANRDEFNSESIVKMHAGAFARVGYGRVYLQPEVYFSAKGGELESSLSKMVTKFDFNNVDVPILLGVKVLKGGVANLRIMGGPVFSFMTSNDVKGEARFTRQYFNDHYYGYQYGAGVDIWKFFLDARMEHGKNSLYEHPDLNSQNRTFMVTVGFKIL